MRYRLLSFATLCAFTCIAEDAPQVGDQSWKIYQSQARTGSDVSKTVQDDRENITRVRCTVDI